MNKLLTIRRGLGLVAIAVSIAVVASLVSNPATKVSRSQAQLAFERGDFETSRESALELLKRQPTSVPLLMLAGTSARNLGFFDEALELFRRIPDSAYDDAAQARFASAEIHSRSGKITLAIESLEQCLKLNPAHDGASEAMVSLLNTVGRRWETLPHLMKVIRSKAATVRQLLFLGYLSKEIEDTAELQRYLQASPEDLQPNLGLARIQIRLRYFDEAEQLLVALLRQQPELVEAHVQLGTVWQLTDPDRLSGWNEKLPAGSELHPEIWNIRGQWARRQGDSTAALRCFLEAIRLDPDHMAALNSAAQQLQLLEQPQRAQAFAERATKLQMLVNALEGISQSTNYMPSIQNASRLTLELGRFWESAGWSAYALSIDPSAQWAKDTMAQARNNLDANVPRTRPEFNLAANAKWISEYPLPEWLTRPATGQTVPRDIAKNGANASSRGNDIRFSKPVANLGIDFTYFASRQPPIDGRRMFEMTGGGVGVIDFDQDGWPDLFFAQGRTWPPEGKDPMHVDKFYRNLGRDSTGKIVFQEVTQQANIDEQAFGQGVSVGDVNSDGFDDIYVSNIGENQLWINQGDGAFSDGNGLINSRSDAWTVSSVIADLTMDGLPEIYDGNYVEGPTVYTQLCNVGGRQRICPPLIFTPSRGRMLSPNQSGSIDDISSLLISPTAKEGNALGVAVFRLAKSILPSLFVANDQVANLMLVPKRRPDAKYGFLLTDEAIVRGIAFDAAGRAQACMGVAAGDANQDGRTDIFVTNFYDESNTLYLQQEGGLFVDATVAAGLAAPSMDKLGFGTQFIDAQLDGLEDLVVLNGHIDDLTHIGVPFQMRHQVFKNMGAAKFEEVEGKSAGVFFETPGLGRALAKLDFDRDGLEDFIATDLTDPVSLLHNDSDRRGSYLSITLIGTKSARNAIGAEVIIRSKSVTQTQQLVGGSGYMASNQRRLHFGLPGIDQADSIEVNWPSGDRTTLQNVKLNQELLIIEGRGALSLP